jgi:hypothetical protein
MNAAKVVWSAQVEGYVRRKAPAPRRELWRAIKGLAAWNGRENPPHLRQLEDDLAGYARWRVKGERIIFREDFEGGQRVIKRLYAGPRQTIYEMFQELLLDEVGSD